MKRHNRNKRGNMFVLTIAISAVLFIPIFIMFACAGPYFLSSERAKNLVEAAGIRAAKDLSRIVIEDPHFGYVSLSNHQPVGKGVCAIDGEPLPVIGINTLIGTVRQNAIIADELQNATMDKLVEEDSVALNATIKNLNRRLTQAVADIGSGKKCFDIQGQAVDPVEDVMTFLQENLPGNIHVESIMLSLGWLQGSCGTTVPFPQPVKLAQLPTDAAPDGAYEAFKNYPVAGRSFSFAGLAPQASHVSRRLFQEADGKHICSVVKLECTLSSTDPTQPKFTFVTCCLPYSQPDPYTPGAMTVRFPGSTVPSVLSWSDFLSNNYFRDNKVTTYRAIDGDYPLEKQSRLQETQHVLPPTTAQQFSEHLYYWLRNGRLRPRLDNVISMINDPFRPGPNEVQVYEFKEDGSIARRIVDGTKFARSVTADGQAAAMADTHTQRGANAIIFFRDNVKQLNIDASKHGGQPLAGYPLSTVDPSMDYETLACNFAKRDPKTQGLALDIEMGGMGASTARNDVISMRERTRSRRI